MKKLNSIEYVNHLKIVNKKVYYVNSKSKELNVIKADLKPQTLANIEVDNFIIQSNSIVFQSDNTIYRLKDNSYYEIVKKDKLNYLGLQNYLFNNKVIIALTKVNDWQAYAMLLITENDKIEKIGYLFYPEIYSNNYYFNHSTKTVFSYTISHKEVWKKDITNFGRNIAKDPKTGEVLWDKPNEIKEALLADDKNIYVPLTGGQLLALDAKTGEKVWMFDNEKLGKYQILDDKIYKGDGKSIIVYDKNNLKIEKKLYFKDVPILKNYIPAGPFLVYNDIIISTDVLYGKICLLNRQTLEVEEFFSLDKKLVNSKDAIIWNDNKLYVLDIDHTLHIFEKTSNETT